MAWSEVKPPPQPEGGPLALLLLLYEAIEPGLPVAHTSVDEFEHSIGEDDSIRDGRPHSVRTGNVRRVMQCEPGYVATPQQSAVRITEAHTETTRKPHW